MLSVVGCADKATFVSAEIRPSEAVCSDVQGLSSYRDLVLCNYSTDDHSRRIEQEFKEAYRTAQSYWEPILPLVAEATLYVDRRIEAETEAQELATARFDLAVSYTQAIDRLVEAMELLDSFEAEAVLQYVEAAGFAALHQARLRLASNDPEPAQQFLNAIDRDFARTPENNGQMAFTRAKLYMVDWEFSGGNGLLRTATRKRPGHLPYLVAARDLAKAAGSQEEFIGYADAVFEATADQQVIASDPMMAAHTFVERAESLRFQGECAQALPLYERGLAMVADQPAIMRVWVLDAWLGRGICAYEEDGDLATFTHLERELAGWPPMHPQTHHSLDVLADYDLIAEDYVAARGHLERLITSIERNYDSVHVDLARARNRLAEAKIGVGDFEDAMDDLELAMSITQRWFGDGHLTLAPTLRLMAVVERGLGQSDAGDDFDRQADESLAAELTGDLKDQLQKAIERNMGRR